MTYKFDYRMGRTSKTRSIRADNADAAREDFDLWRAAQGKRVHLLRVWVA